MKKWIRMLEELGGREERNILGLMSGTSMDGIDLALCRISGSGLSCRAELLETGGAEIPSGLESRFRDLAFDAQAPLGEIMRLHAELTSHWCSAVSGQAAEWASKGHPIDLAASHGQTVFHQPDREDSLHATLQLVDGDPLARSLGMPVVSDFRQKHIAAGFEGAPLAPLAEVLLFAHPEEKRVLLNLGGIANFTFLDAGITQPDVPFATDTGPANTLLDAAVRRLQPGMRYDTDGGLARAGSVNEELLADMLEHPFFSRPFPKSTGQEEFSWDWLYSVLLRHDPGMEVRNLLATLTECTARSVGEALKTRLKEESCTIYLSGGGANNSWLVERLQHHLPKCRIESSRSLGMDPEVKEAMLFAVLANETVAGEGWIGPRGERFTLGKISLPDG